MSEAMDNINLLEDEYNSLERKFIEAVAENKRLRFLDYGKHDQRFQHKLTQGVTSRSESKIDSYFDVTKWLWVAVIDVPYHNSDMRRSWS